MSNLGFYGCVRDGGDVMRLTRAGKPTGRAIKGALRLGEELAVPTLMGRVKAKVTRCGDKEATAETEGLLLPLHFGEDDRDCWTCSVSLDKRGIGRFAT